MENLDMDLKKRLVVGVDLGGTKIDIGLVDEMGRISHNQRLVTPVASGAQAVENLIVKTIQDLQKAAGYPLLGVGIGVAGQIDRSSGTVLFAPNLKWDHYPIRENMEKALGLPVRVINDARALTLGEWQYGAGKGFQDIVCMFIGTGIGGGIVSGGNLLSGCSNTSGEVGHMTIDLNGPVCTCGKRGCLEAIAGGWGIAARAREAVTAGGKEAGRRLLESAENQLEKITALLVVQAFREGDPLAKQVVENACRALVSACASLVNILNPCRLVIGGGFVEGMPELIGLIEQHVRQASLKAATQSLEIVKAKLGKELGVLGAAAVIFNLLKGSNNS